MPLFHRNRRLVRGAPFDSMMSWVGHASTHGAGNHARATAHAEVAHASRYLKIPEGAKKIGYHGTDLEGMRSLLKDGVRSVGRSRSGRLVPNDGPTLYITDCWEDARRYAASVETIVEIWCSDLSELVHPAFCRNIGFANEVKLFGGFETLTIVPAHAVRHLPTSFHALGFGQDRGMSAAL